MTGDEGGEDDEREERRRPRREAKAGRLIACDKLLGDMMGTGDYVRRWR